MTINTFQTYHQVYEKECKTFTTTQIAKSAAHKSSTSRSRFPANSCALVISQRDGILVNSSQGVSGVVVYLRVVVIVPQYVGKQ